MNRNIETFTLIETLTFSLKNMLQTAVTQDYNFTFTFILF